MSEWWGISKQNKLKKFQGETNQFVNNLESTIKDFEEKGNVDELVSKLKSSIREFQNENKN